MNVPYREPDRKSIEMLGVFFSLLFLFANKVSSTVCNVSNFVLTPYSYINMFFVTSMSVWG
jgi:hypothetical protein